MTLDGSTSSCSRQTAHHFNGLIKDVDRWTECVSFYVRAFAVENTELSRSFDNKIKGRRAFFTLAKNPSITTEIKFQRAYYMFATLQIEYRVQLFFFSTGKANAHIILNFFQQTAKNGR